MKEFIDTYKRQLIYIEAVVYMFLITVTIYASIESSIYFKFIPLTFILGILGVYFFDKKLVTSIFGFCIAMCILKITFYKSFEYTLFYSIYFGISILLGELLGGFIKNMSLKNKTDNNPKSIIFAFVVLILGVYINSVINGNIFSFIRSKNSLNKYLKENYNEYNLTITPNNYLFGEYDIYSFDVYGFDLNSYTMSVTDENKVIDGYYEVKITKLNKQTEDNLKFINLDKYKKVDINVKYNSLDSQELYIKNKDYTVEELVIVSDNILKEFLNLSNFSNINSLVIINNDTIGTINKDKFHNIDYYTNSLNEYIIVN